MKYSLNKMMALDIYLSSLSKSEYAEVMAKTKRSTVSLVTPLLSWDAYSEGYFNTLQAGDKQQDILKVKSYAHKMNWQNNLDAIFEKEVFEAIVITDINQNIIWVNKGFSKMTGYTKAEVLKKKPNLLQGTETSNEVKRNIKQQLKNNLPFKEVITNYKKSGEAYTCEVKIFPLHTNDNKTHFMALERQVS